MKISIIIPVYNEEYYIKKSLSALTNLIYPKDDYEIIVVNDGSTDRTLKSIREKIIIARNKNLKIKIVNLKTNEGRSKARNIGAKKSKYNNLLFIDSRTIADKSILINLKKINYQPLVGNAIIDHTQSDIHRFKYLIKLKLYPNSFGNKFIPTYITKDNFDKISKGTGVFFCDKDLFLSSQPQNQSKNSSDDTKLLFTIVQKRNILKHPGVIVKSEVRSSLKDEIIHTYNRGIKFTDYYLNIKKKNFWIFIFLPSLTILITIFIFLNYIFLIPYYLLLLIIFFVNISIFFSNSISDFFIISKLLIILGFSFILGIYRGLALKIIDKF